MPIGVPKQLSLCQKQNGAIARLRSRDAVGLKPGTILCKVMPLVYTAHVGCRHCRLGGCCRAANEDPCRCFIMGIHMSLVTSTTKHESRSRVGVEPEGTRGRSNFRGSAGNDDCGPAKHSCQANFPC